MKYPVGYFIINTNLGNYQGHSINVTKTIEGMRAAGLDIRIVAPRFDPHIDLEKVFRDYTLTGPLPVVQLWVPGRNPTRWLFMYYTCAVWFWLAKEIVCRRCQFMYVRSEYLFPLVWLSKITGTPLFYEIHRVGLTKRVQRIKEYLARGARSIITLTEGLKTQFAPHNTSAHVEHDAVNYEHFAVSDDKSIHRKKLGWATGATIMVYAGSVQPIKGVEMIVENAEVFPDVQFYIIGRIKASMETYMQTLPSNVHALGDYTHEQLPAYLKAADVLLLPHPDGPQSQSPMKLFEYLATGRPILSSALPNIQEVLPAENLWFTASDHPSYQAAVRSYLAEPTSCDSRLKTINQTVAKEHTYAKRGGRIATFVESAISNMDQSR